MSEKELRKMIAVTSRACDVAFRGTGMVAPMWFAVSASGEKFDVEPPSFLGKDTCVAMVRAFFKTKDVVRYVFVDEAWTIERAINDKAELDSIYRHGVASHPDRVEVVVIQGEDRDCGQIVAHRRIMRPANQRPYLAPLEVLIEPRGAALQSEGRMVGMLPPRGTLQ
jgi:hypothetical protein